MSGTNPQGATADKAHVTRADLMAGLARLGLRAGDTVLAHSSLSRFGHVEGGAETVIEALLETLGPAGTLMMSAITTSSVFVIACITAAERGEVAAVEPFDVAGASTYAGAIAATFRKRPGVQRSWHPTHSVSAWGARAEELIAGHENAPGPCGEGTPYMRLCGLERGFVLLLGVNHMANTTLHGFEEIAPTEYALFREYARVPIRTPAGPREARTRVHNAFMQRHLGILETDYLDGRAQTVTHIGDSCVRLAHGGRMRDITLAALRADPLRLLNARGRVAWARMKASGVFTRDPLTPDERAGLVPVAAEEKR